jgi:hypothetical protein
LNCDKIVTKFFSSSPTVKKIPHQLQVGAQRSSVPLIQPHPRTMKKTLLAILGLAAVSLAGVNGQTLITSDYTQNFDSIGSGLPTDWSARLSANATSLGTVSTNYTATAGTNTAWANTTGAFKNFASTAGLTSTSNSTEQANSLNRSLGLRPTGSFGDVGASLNFNFSTTGTQIASISLNALMLSTDTRSQTWSLQYGIGASPTSFTTLGTWADPGAWGSTTLSYNRTDFGAALDDQSNVWFRFVGLSASTGTGSRDSMGIDDFGITVVPEPTTWALIGLGTAFVLWRMRRRRVVG